MPDVLAEVEMLLLLLGLAPELREAVGLALSVLLRLAVEEGVPAALPVPLTVALPVAVALPVPLAVAVPERDALTVVLPEKEALPVLEGEAPTEREAVGEALSVLLRLLLGEPVMLPVPLPL